MATALCHGASFLGCRPLSKRRANVARCTFACRAQMQEADATPAMKLLAAGLAAAALISSSPAYAGVKFEKAVVKKVFQSEPEAPKAAAAKAEKKSSSSGFSLPTPSFSLEAGSVALPGAVIGLGALGFAASKLDAGFGTFINDAMAKDSTSYAGYEEVLKSANGVPPKAKAATKAVKSGTKKLFGRK